MENKNIVPSEEWEQDKYCRCPAFRYPEKEIMCPKCKRIVPSQATVLHQNWKAFYGNGKTFTNPDTDFGNTFERTN